MRKNAETPTVSSFSVSSSDTNLQNISDGNKNLFFLKDLLTEIESSHLSWNDICKISKKTKKIAELFKSIFGSTTNLILTADNGRDVLSLLSYLVSDVYYSALEIGSNSDKNKALEKSEKSSYDDTSTFTASDIRINDLKSQMDQLKLANIDMRERINKSFEMLRTQSDNESQSYKTDSTDLISSLLEENERMCDKMAFLIDQFDILQKQNDSMLLQIEAKTTEVVSLKTRVCELDKEVQKLSIELNESKENLSDAHSKHQELKEENKRLLSITKNYRDKYIQNKQQSNNNKDTDSELVNLRNSFNRISELYNQQSIENENLCESINKQKMIMLKQSTFIESLFDEANRLSQRIQDEISLREKTSAEDRQIIDELYNQLNDIRSVLIQYVPSNDIKSIPETIKRIIHANDLRKEETNKRLVALCSSQIKFTHGLVQNGYIDTRLINPKDSCNDIIHDDDLRERIISEYIRAKNFIYSNSTHGYDIEEIDIDKAIRDIVDSLNDDDIASQLVFNVIALQSQIINIMREFSKNVTISNDAISDVLIKISKEINHTGDITGLCDKIREVLQSAEEFAAKISSMTGKDKYDDIVEEVQCLVSVHQAVKNELGSLFDTCSDVKLIPVAAAKVINSLKPESSTNLNSSSTHNTVDTNAVEYNDQATITSFPDSKSTIDIATSSSIPLATEAVDTSASNKSQAYSCAKSDVVLSDVSTETFSLQYKIDKEKHCDHKDPRSIKFQLNYARQQIEEQTKVIEALRNENSTLQANIEKFKEEKNNCYKLAASMTKKLEIYTERNRKLCRIAKGFKVKNQRLRKERVDISLKSEERATAMLNDQYQIYKTEINDIKKTYKEKIKDLEASIHTKDDTISKLKNMTKDISVTYEKQLELVTDDLKRIKEENLVLCKTFEKYKEKSKAKEKQSNYVKFDEIIKQLEDEKSILGEELAKLQRTHYIENQNREKYWEDKLKEDRRHSSHKLDILQRELEAANGILKQIELATKDVVSESNNSVDAVNILISTIKDKDYMISKLQKDIEQQIILRNRLTKIIPSSRESNLLDEWNKWASDLLVSITDADCIGKSSKELRESISNIVFLSNNGRRYSDKLESLRAQKLILLKNQSKPEPCFKKIGFRTVLIVVMAKVRMCRKGFYYSSNILP